MVTWTQLLLPAAASTGLVFVASSVVHMVLQWHKPDYRSLASEDATRQAIRAGHPTPGQYVLPHCAEMKQAAEPAMVAKYQEGPNAVLYVGPNGPPAMGKLLGSWVVYSLFLSLAAGYIAKATLPAGAPYLTVFQVVGAAAFLGYAGQSASDSIWKFKPWIVTFRSMADGLLYAAVTAAAFAWLWP